VSWSSSQKGVIHAYSRYAGLAPAEYRTLLREATGETSAASPHLTQYHFDVVMPLLEIAAHLAFLNGAAVGKRPRCIRDWYHWRNRHPHQDAADTRQLWLIGNRLWPQLCELLPNGDRHDRYLAGIASRACGRDIGSIADLRRGEAAVVIVALTRRFAQEQRRRNAQVA